MTNPLIVHHSDVAVSGMQMVRVVRWRGLFNLAFSGFFYWLSFPDFVWPLGIFVFFSVGLIVIYFEVNRVAKASGLYRILIKDNCLIRESAHSWFGDSFSVPLSEISEVLIDGYGDDSKYEYYVVLADSRRIKIIDDYGFCPSILFDVLVQLDVVKSITRKNR